MKNDEESLTVTKKRLCFYASPKMSLVEQFYITIRTVLSTPKSNVETSPAL